MEGAAFYFIGTQKLFLIMKLASLDCHIMLNQVLPEIQKVIERLKEQIKEKDVSTKKPRKKSKKRK